MARSVIVKVLLSPQEAVALDRLRVAESRSSWLRDLLLHAALAAQVLEEASSEAEGASTGEQAGPVPVGPSGPVGPAASPRASAPVKRAASPPMPVRPLVSQPRPLVQKRG